MRWVSAERSCGITVAGVGELFLQNRHARDMRQCLPDQQIGLTEFAGPATEQAQGAQNNAGGAHGHRMHGGDAHLQRGRNELRPPGGRVAQICHRDRMAGGIALHAGPLVGLQLEEFQFTGLPGGRGQQAQLPQRVGEQESRRRDIQQVGAALGELGEQVDDVEVVEQFVDERYDRAQYTSFTRGIGHVALLFGLH